MVPQGSTLFNAAYFDSLIAAIDSVESPVELQGLVDDAAGAITPVQAAITAQLAKVAPLAALLSPPSSPDAAVTWISSFITNFLTPLAAPAITLPAQAALLTTKSAEVAAAVARARDRIPGCTVTTPF